MVTQQVIVTNQLGIHIRAAGKLIHCAQRFGSRIFIIKNEKRADAKSILNIMMLGVKCGDHVQVEAEGEDAEAAVLALITLIHEKFGES